MNDLISREALKHFVNHEMNTDRMYETEERRDSCYAFRDELFKYIDNAPPVCGNNPKWCENCVSRGKCASTRPHGEWIPVSERLPEKHVEVLATTDWGAVTIAEMYTANDWFIHEGTTNADTDEITAWMPLPEPYKKGGAK